MKDYKVSIAIPHYKQWGLLNTLLQSLRTHEEGNIDEVIIVDDASPTVETVISELPIEIIRNPVNAGFTISSNRALMRAGGILGEKRIIFLISTDVQINGRFVEQTADILFSGRNYLVGNRHIAFDSGWNTFEGKTFDYLEGWFLAATSDGWRELGYFDPIYAPYDYEDIDLATTAKTKGYKLVSLNNPHVVHLGAGTIGFNPAREAITIRNKERFREKWIR